MGEAAALAFGFAALALVVAVAGVRRQRHVDGVIEVVVTTLVVVEAAGHAAGTTLVPALTWFAAVPLLAGAAVKGRVRPRRIVRAALAAEMLVMGVFSVAAALGVDTTDGGARGEVGAAHHGGGPVTVLAVCLIGAAAMVAVRASAHRAEHRGRAEVLLCGGLMYAAMLLMAAP